MKLLRMTQLARCRPLALSFSLFPLLLLSSFPVPAEVVVLVPEREAGEALGPVQLGAGAQGRAGQGQGEDQEQAHYGRRQSSLLGQGRNNNNIDDDNRGASLSFSLSLSSEAQNSSL